MILQLSFCWALHYHLLHDPFSWWTGRLLASSMFNSIRMEMRNVYKCKNVKQRTCLMSSWSLCTLFFFFPKYFTSKNICWWCVREHTWFLTILFHLVKLLCCNCGLSLNWKKKKKKHGQEASWELVSADLVWLIPEAFSGDVHLFPLPIVGIGGWRCF